MKTLLLFFLLLIAANSFAQTDTTLKYTEIIQVEGLSKQVLYQRARSWTNDVFKSSKDVIQIEDKENGEIAGKAVFAATISWNALGKRTAETTVNFKFQVIVKDGKYKYILTDFIEDGYYDYLLTSTK